MAAASYTTDLTDFEDFETASSVTEVTGYTATRAFEDLDGDNPIQGTRHASAEQRTTGTGSIVSSGTGTTLAAGEAFFFWQNFLQAGAVNTFDNNGIVGIVGTATNAYYRWTIGGSGFGRNPYGGWANQVCDPTITTGRTQQGAPGTSYSIVGFGCDVIAAISKGSPYNLDVIRYGRGEIVVTDGDLANGYATFEGIATQNDALTNRWGLFQFQAGSYLWKGLLSLGTATAVDFRDSNRVIVIDNTIVVSSSFNRIEINNASSNVEWSSINISALGTVARGEFEVIDNATVSLDTCVFTDMSTFIFQSNSTLLDTTFRRCNTVTQGSSTITRCTFANSTAATSLLSNSLTDVSACTFVSDGSNHAIELTTVPATYTWNHTTTGYATGSLGVEGTDFTAGSTGNETLFINATSSQNIVITIPAGITTPSIRRGASYTGQITVQVQAKTIDVNVKDELGANISGAFVWLNDGAITIFNGTTDASGNIPQQSYSGTNNTTLRVRRFGDKPFETTLGTASGSVSQLVTMVNDRQQVAVPTLNQTWAINTGTSTITVSGGSALPHTDTSTIDTGQDLYEFVMNTFAATAFMQFPVPFESITRVQYNFINGYTFGAKDTDYKYLYEGSFEDAANSLLWSNIRTIGTQQTGTGIYIVQGVEASDAALTSWWPNGNINVLVKVQDGTFIQSTDDTGTNIDGGVWLFAREYTDLYDHSFVDLSVGGQSVVALSTFDDLNNQTASGTVATYTDISFTFGATSQDIGDGNGNQPYNVIVDCNGRTLKEVYEYTKYITSFDFSQTVNGENGYEYRNASESTFSAVDNKQAPFGTFAGGRFFGAQGVFLTNMASSDNTNYQLIDSNGITRFPPQTVSFELTGLKDGTEIRIHNYADNTVVAGVEDITGGVATSPTTGVTTSGTTDNNTFVYTYTYSSDISVYIRVLNLSYIILSLGRPQSAALTLSSSNQSIPVSQQIDRNYEDL